MDTFTSFLAGITIFSVLGNLAFETGKNVADVAGGGPGLAFISYPDAIAKFNFVPQVKDKCQFLIGASIDMSFVIAAVLRPVLSDVVYVGHR